MVVIYVLVISTFASVQASRADSCPVRLVYAGLVGLGEHHGTADYEMLFGRGVGNNAGLYAVNITAEMSDGSRVHLNVADVSSLAPELVLGTSEVTLYPFATEVRSFRIDSARDLQGLSTCSDDSPYMINNGAASQCPRFDDGPASRWPVKSSGTLEFADAGFISRATPNYPITAQNLGIQGEARVFVVIRPDGSLDSASIDRSSGNDLLDQAALDAARRSTFKAAHLSEEWGGIAITSAYYIIYQFRIN